MRSNSERTLLHFAAENYQAEVIRFVVKAMIKERLRLPDIGKFIDAQDKTSSTAIHLLARIAIKEDEKATYTMRSLLPRIENSHCYLSSVNIQDSSMTTQIEYTVLSGNLSL